MNPHGQKTAAQRWPATRPHKPSWQRRDAEYRRELAQSGWTSQLLSGYCAIVRPNEYSVRGMSGRLTDRP